MDGIDQQMARLTVELCRGISEFTIPEIAIAWINCLRRRLDQQPGSGQHEKDEAHHRPSEIDGREHFRRLFVEGLANGQEAFDAGHVGAALNGTDLRNTEPGGGGEVLQ